MDATNQEFTGTPNYILLDNRLSLGAKLTWQIFAMQENLKNETRNLDVVARMLGKHIDTTRGYVKELIKYGYLNRRKKDTQEFGYIYWIPEEHIFVNKTLVEDYSVEVS